MTPLESQVPTQDLEVLETTEGYNEVDGSYIFTGTNLVYKSGNHLHHAHFHGRYASRSEVRIEDLSANTLIPVSAYCPSFPAGFSYVPNPEAHDCFVKKPRLDSYDQVFEESRPGAIAESMLQEAAVCEMLKRNPHPNMATYLGCQVSDGRIEGLCFIHYGKTLMQEVNPGSHMKRELTLRRQGGDDYSAALGGIERGLRHLHALGWVHNDINPSNIMLGDGKAVIIDFGSCRQVGESLEGVGRTFEWFDENVKTAFPQNDLDALDEIRIWLGDVSKSFKFEE